MSSAGMPTQRLGPGFTQWQYHVVRLDIDSFGFNINPQQVQDVLNQVGSDGWELANTVDVNRGHGRTSELVFIFKRPLGQRP